MITIAENRKATFNFFISDEIEAGIVLTGTEVKSLRQNKVTLGESYIFVKNGEIWIQNLQIAQYKAANQFNHDPKRLKKILLRKKQIKKLTGKTTQENSTIIPLSMYFNERGKIKLNICLAKGKKKFDKRETIKEREWNRKKSRIS